MFFSVEIVLVGLSDLKTKLPATKTSAPASIKSFAFLSLIPPSISISALESDSSIKALKALIFEYVFSINLTKRLLSYLSL